MRALPRGTLGRTCHVSAGEQCTNREVITSILRQLGKPESLMTRVLSEAYRAAEALYLTSGNGPAGSPLLVGTGGASPR